MVAEDTALSCISHLPFADVTAGRRPLFPHLSTQSLIFLQPHPAPSPSPQCLLQLWCHHFLLFPGQNLLESGPVSSKRDGGQAGWSPDSGCSGLLLDSCWLSCSLYLVGPGTATFLGGCNLLRVAPERGTCGRWDTGALCPAALGLGSPFQVGRESGGRATLLGGTLRLLSGIRLAGLGMAEGSGSRLQGLAAAPCGRGRR